MPPPEGTGTTPETGGPVTTSARAPWRPWPTRQRGVRQTARRGTPLRRAPWFLCMSTAMRVPYSIVVPARDEEETIGVVLSDVCGLTTDLIVVDGASSD